jgi:hypothetical protein
VKRGRSALVEQARPVASPSAPLGDVRNSEVFMLDDDDITTGTGDGGADGAAEPGPEGPADGGAGTGDGGADGGAEPGPEGPADGGA